MKKEETMEDFTENASTTAVAEHPRRGSISGIGPQQGL